MRCGSAEPSGSQRWQHGGPPKMNMKILAAHHTPFYLSLGLFNTLIELELTYLVAS